MSDQAEVCPLSRGVLSPFGGSHGAASRFNPYPAHYSLAFASSAILYPQAHRLTLRLAFPCGPVHRETFGLTTFRASTLTAWVRFCLSAGGATSAMGEFEAPIPDPLPVGPSL